MCIGDCNYLKRKQGNDNIANSVYWVYIEEPLTKSLSLFFNIIKNFKPSQLDCQISPEQPKAIVLEANFPFTGYRMAPFQQG